MKNESNYPRHIYRILVKETLDQNFIDRLSNFHCEPQEDGKTMIIGSFSDQPDLRGFLDQLWNLNITILSVERNKNEN